ncbi:TOBE domain-containing protein [Vulcanococcus limneticus Candia 3F8]|uniref:TOBE domain-containing protein n=1 Tax=Vulcanococcus limneticus TaxID=2170428 RepID=UPI000D5270B1|nr:TOBE domain-containing protein [Vulcanococcus limneticus MW73D5]MCP9894843.1 TOBE domain-containing protein [Vulcanococcus limneticus Candia 3F8]MCP9898686.1 TOBE domain-containing protein [Vulcanococcus limneticus Candia 3B3]
MVLGSGDLLVAMVTNRSVYSLLLAAGKEVIALIKASTPLTQADTFGYKLCRQQSQKHHQVGHGRRCQCRG